MGGDFRDFLLGRDLPFDFAEPLAPFLAAASGLGVPFDLASALALIGFLASTFITNSARAGHSSASTLTVSRARPIKLIRSRSREAMGA